jgi:hypothetical protein
VVARVDPAFDRKAKRLSIRAISIELGPFVGATALDSAGHVPSRWRRTLSG